jgi:hypothetical protein
MQAAADALHRAMSEETNGMLEALALALNDATFGAPNQEVSTRRHILRIVQEQMRLELKTDSIASAATELLSTS